MCNCIKNLEKDLVGRVIDRKRVMKATLVIPYITMSGGLNETNGQIELTLEGQKKKVTKAVAHKYCPLCGKKYPEPAEWKTIEA
jgi:hypothetical protein